MESIADQKLILVQPDGSRREFVLRIGKPYSVSALEWACPIEAGAIGIGADSIHGVDSFQSLVLAVNLIRQVMLDLSESGFSFVNFEDNSSVDITQLFTSGA